MKNRWKDIDGETESEIWRVLEPLGVFVNNYSPYMTLWLTNTTDERATSYIRETPALYGYLVTQERLAVERLRAPEAKESGDELPDNHESNVKEIDSWLKGYRGYLQALEREARRVLYLNDETAGASNSIRKFHATHAPVSEWREDTLCSRLDELEKAASLSKMVWDALGNRRIVLKEVGGTECGQCREAILRWPALAGWLGYSEFPG